MAENALAGVPVQRSQLEQFGERATGPSPSALNLEALSPYSLVGALVEALGFSGDAMRGRVDWNTPEAKVNALAAASMAMGGGPGTVTSGIRTRPGIKAYHGSPHSFDKFDMSKIGTGEGAQAYGHGLYFAEKEGVARSYRDALTGGRAFDVLDDFLLKHRGMNYRPEEIAAKLKGTPAEALAGDPKALDALRRLLPQYTPNAPVTGAELQHYRYLNDAAENAVKGSMYEVRINAEPQQFLDWDAPLSGKPAEIFENRLGMDIAEHPTAGSAVKYATREIGDPAEVSQILKDQGIPGIRYLDQGSRAAGDGSRNYVLFRDDIIEILKKYGVAGLALAGIGTAGEEK